MELNFEVNPSDLVRKGRREDLRKCMLDFIESGMCIAELVCDTPDSMTTQFCNTAYSIGRSFPAIKVMKRSDKIYLVKKEAQPCKPQ